MTLGDVIARYRAENGLSMDQFALRSGISKAYISMLEKNKTHRGSIPVPSIETYQNVAKAIGMDTDELIRVIDGKVSLVASPLLPTPVFKEWPVIGATACGDPVHREVEETVVAPADIQADAVFRCDGDSMTGARILDGDYVFIRFDAPQENGDICLVRVDDEYTLKRVYGEPGQLRLVAENPSYPTRIITGADLDTVEIVGKAVFFLSKVV